MTKFLASLVTVILSMCVVLADPPTPKVTLDRAKVVLDELDKLKSKGIPTKLMTDAKAVVIVPNLYKGGFVIGGRVGHGVALVKDEKGNWGEPTFVNIRGASIGFQAGVQASDVLLVFHKVESLEKALTGKGKLTLGVDAGVAAGPVGRQAIAATDLKLDSEIYSYSRSRGLFAGVSLDGANLTREKEANEKYAADQTPEIAQSLADLKNRLLELAKELPQP
ncbi:MAG: lipid-binding SYLF domain-containing protein [Fimbriiglobus sp.]